MAPRKTAPRAPLAWYSLALDPPNMSEKNLALALLMTVVQGSEAGKTMLRPGSAQPEGKGSTFYPFFMSAIIADLVSPFSEFFLLFFANTICTLCISTPTLSFSWRFSPTTVRHMSG